MIGTNQFNAGCVKCKRGPISNPRYAARSKQCKRWWCGCRRCFVDQQGAKKSVVKVMKAGECYKDCSTHLVSSLLFGALK